MKLKKKTVMLLSFALGAMLVATTALADIASKSGYEQLKDAVKSTGNSCANKFDSYTMETSSVVKDNGKVVSSSSSVSKHDTKNKAQEGTTEQENVKIGKTKFYSYNDKHTSISWQGGDNTYRVAEFSKENTSAVFRNPFIEPKAEDIEKIVDAVIGSLKDSVVVTDNSDGSKTFSGSLSEVQIPPIVNAGASLLIKQEYSSQNAPISVDRDIFGKAVKGTAIVKNGVVENILVTAVLSGKDQKGQIHEITCEFLFKLTGINSTTVSKPDMTGKNVVKEAVNNGPNISNPQKFVGKYKNDIIIEKDGKFIKIGERVLEITTMAGNSLTGRYHQEYRPGFEQYARETLDITFAGEYGKDLQKYGPEGGEFTYTDKSGNKVQGNVFFDQRRGQVHFMPSAQMPIDFDTSFNPMVE